MFELLPASPMAGNAAHLHAQAFRTAAAALTLEAWPHDAIEACAIEGGTAADFHPTGSLEQAS